MKNGLTWQLCPLSDLKIHLQTTFESLTAPSVQLSISVLWNGYGFKSGIFWIEFLVDSSLHLTVMSFMDLQSFRLLRYVIRSVLSRQEIPGHDTDLFYLESSI